MLENIKKRKITDASVIDMLESLTGYRREVCEALAMREIDTPEKADNFLHPFINNLTPVENYSGMTEARDRIRDAVNFGEHVLIYGDYDCDGVCATAILYLMLKSMNVNVDYYIPVRKKEGYGINRDALEEIAEKISPDLIITVDCGIGSADDINYAMDELGLEFIVTDHHEAPKILPDCIIVDPKAEKADNTFNELCGAGVALRLVEALGGVNAMMYYVDIAALATIADVVPLISDNRIIVNYGIDIINARARQSMKLLLDLSYPNEPNKIVNSTDIAYKIVPKINAVGRLADSKKSVELLIDDDYFYAKSLVQSAIETNAERQRLTEEVYGECLYKLESYDFTKRSVVLYADKWEIGVLGIVSARIAQEFLRPTILMTLSDGLYKGSCRSIEGVNLYETLKRSSMYLNSYGGHAMACGVSSHPDNVEDFAAAFEYALTDADEELFKPSSIYDLKISADEFDVKLMDDMSVLEPFGTGNPQINYLIKAGDVKRVGKSEHAKVELNEEGELMAFHCYNRFKALNGVGEKYYLVNGSNAVYQNRKYASGIILETGVDLSKAKPDGRYAAVRHAYQLMSDKESLFDIERADDELIDKFLENSIYGTCFLCYNVNTYKRFREKFGNRLIIDFTVLSGVNPYNRLVFDVNVNENLVYYQNIVLLDKPMRNGLINELRLNRNCRVFEYSDSMSGYTENLLIMKANYPSVERMREIFKAIAGTLRKKEYLSFSELFPDVAEEVGLVEFYLAMYVFFELKIIVMKGCLRVDAGVKTSLDKSPIYRRLGKLIRNIGF